MTPIITITTKLCVVPSGKPIYDEAATLVGIDDAGGGLFVTIRQEDNLDTNEVKIDPEEWPAIRAAVNRMVRECAKGEQ